MRLEDVIFTNLLQNEDYARKVLPHLKADYFQDHVDAKIFTVIDDYTQKYNRVPSKEALAIDLENVKGLTEEQYSQSLETVKGLNDVALKDETWLLEQTEKFCQDKALYNSIRESISILDDPTGKLSKGSIPGLLTEALGVSFDNNIGHSWADDAEARYEFYHRKEERVPFDIEYFNKVTKGGLPKKTLTILLASTGVGKSLMMCHMAAANLLLGKNVLYITLELAEERIAERIDANLLNISLDDLMETPKDVYFKRLNRVKEKLTGKLIIKEYPTSSAGAANFRHLINELRLKKNFVPDVIYIDYLSNCISSRYKNVSNHNSYTIGKAIAEELRSLAVEFNLPLITAMQTNRSGYNNSDMDLTSTSESMGAPMTADVMWAIIATEELLQMGQYLVKQLKNRFSDIERMKRFVVGVDKMKMRLYDIDEPEKGIMKEPSPPPSEANTMVKFDKSKFEGFK